jgi:hypothetical protein
MIKRLCVSSVLLTVLTLGSATIAQDQPGDRAALEKQWTQKLTNARLVGFFVITGREGPPQQDQYTLRKVEKSEGDKWLFTAVIQYGNRNIALPVEVPVLWAGDTPVISVTNMTLPGLGTYTARVMFYGDQYAGTWSSANHGGFMWGHIVPVAHEATTKTSQPAK